MNLADAQIAILAENMYQELELWYPLMRLREEGCNVVVVGPAEQTYASKLGYPVKPDLAIADADPAAFDAVVIPGGFAPENMRRHRALIVHVVRLDRVHLRSRRPIKSRDVASAMTAPMHLAQRRANRPVHLMCPARTTAIGDDLAV